MNANSNSISAPWNSLVLKPPHFEFFESSARNNARARKALISEYGANQNRELLFLEAVTLFKFMASRKDKYRSDKGFKAVPKIVKAVRRVHQLDLKAVTTLMKANLSFKKFAPSRQLCQWVLIKLQSNGLLLKRIIECCKSSIAMLNHRLRTGHTWIEVILVMAMISRIWSLGTFLMKTCCYSYKLLAEIEEDLPLNPKDRNWAFSDYQFPENLEHWINQPHNIPSFSNMHTVSEVSRNESKHILLSDEHRARVLKTVKTLTSYKHLKSFILRERKRRHSKRKTCLSKNLDDSHWFIFQKKLNTLLKQLQATDDKLSLLREVRKLLFYSLMKRRST